MRVEDRYQVEGMGCPQKPKILGADVMGTKKQRVVVQLATEGPNWALPPGKTGARGADHSDPGSQRQSPREDILPFI